MFNHIPSCHTLQHFSTSSQRKLDEIEAGVLPFSSPFMTEVGTSGFDDYGFHTITAVGHVHVTGPVHGLFH